MDPLAQVLLLGAFALTAVLLRLVRRRRERIRVDRFLDENPGVEAALDTPMPPVILPGDPTALTTRVVVPARLRTPGAEFWAPAAPMGFAQATASDGSRQEATIMLTSRAAFLVVRLGPLGDREPAALRPDRTLQEGVGRLRREGLLTPVATAAGPAWRHTVRFSRSTAVTDWHIDHDGWAYVLGFVRGPEDEDLLPVAERIIASWRWLPPLPAGDETGVLV